MLNQKDIDEIRENIESILGDGEELPFDLVLCRTNPNTAIGSFYISCSFVGEGNELKCRGIAKDRMLQALLGIRKLIDTTVDGILSGEE